jgi:glutamate dehydrogenase
MSGQSDVILQKLLSDAASRWAPGDRLSPESADAVRRFLPLYYRHTDPEEISGRSPEQVCGTAGAHRSFGAERAPGRPGECRGLSRVERPCHHGGPDRRR